MARQSRAECIEARNDVDELFDVQHLTRADIAQLEDALNTMDMEELVFTVDQILCNHLRRLEQKHPGHTGDNCI
jgi:hypothetical protein